MNRDKIKELLETLKSNFKVVANVAWDNCPDAKYEEAEEEFEDTVKSAEEEFNKAYDTIMEESKLDRDQVIENGVPAKVFVYKHYNDDITYMEEVIRVYADKKDAIAQLKADVEAHCNAKWEDIPSMLPVYGYDLICEDYVSIAVPCEDEDETKTNLYWIIEECPVNGVH